MCGRYRLRRYELIRAVFEALGNSAYEEFSEFDIRWWNIAPSQHVPIVRLDSERRRVIARAQWGFIPAWSKGLPKTRPINARAETIATNGLFRNSLFSHRCLIPADGFYEWKGTKTPRSPYFIHMKNDAIFAFAGLWERWLPENGNAPIDTCTIITTQPNAIMSPIHDRMPVIVSPRDYRRWLDPENASEKILDILIPYPAEEMSAYQVSSTVNNSKSDGPELVIPATNDLDLFGN